MVTNKRQSLGLFVGLAGRRWCGFVCHCVQMISVISVISVFVACSCCKVAAIHGSLSCQITEM